MLFGEVRLSDCPAFSPLFAMDPFLEPVGDEGA